MLTKVKLMNFKPIQGTLELKLSPLTVLSGTNSSGKSSILQAIRLISQTVSSPLRSDPLVLNGHSLQMGSYDLVCNDRARDSRTLGLGFTIELDSKEAFSSGFGFGRNLVQLATIECFGRFQQPKDDGTTFENVQPNARLLGTELITTAQFRSRDRELARMRGSEPEAASDANKNITYSFKVSSMTDQQAAKFFKDASPDGFPRRRRDQGHLKLSVSIDGEGKRSEHLIPEIQHFVPRLVFRRFEVEKRNNRNVERIVDWLVSGRDHERGFHVEDMMGREVVKRVSKDILENVSGRDIKDIRKKTKELAEKKKVENRISDKTTFQELAQWVKGASPEIERDFRELVRAKVADKIPQFPEGRKYSFEPVFDDVTDVLMETDRYIDQFFTSEVRYLGPLRIGPNHAQGYPPTDFPFDIGTSGEYAASVFNTYRNMKVTFLNPIDGRDSSMTLYTAVDFWLQYLGLGYRVKSEHTQTAGFVWQIEQRKGEMPRGLGAVGVGVSQVLPILVLGLTAREGSLLLIEQPELHLHPAPQAKLADFFVSLAARNRQCIIETHSDALVGRLRLLMVTRGETTGETTQIYFASRTDKGQSSFEAIKVSSSGNIMNWPEGFFDTMPELEERIFMEGRKRSQIGDGHG